MNFRQIMAEMARRKVQFHKDEKWNEISCFGLFQWGTISKYLVGNENMKTFVSPLFINSFGSTRENKIIWVKPTKECWEKYIKPLIEKHTLVELQEMSWG